MQLNGIPAVICEVIFEVTYQTTDSEGRPNCDHVLIGLYETEQDAEQALTDNGFIKKSWWVGDYKWGTIARTLRETS